MKIVNKQIILYSCLWILPVHTQNNIEQVFANYQGVKIKWFVEKKKQRTPKFWFKISLKSVGSFKKCWFGITQRFFFRNTSQYII